jgi:hypothetical protein
VLATKSDAAEATRLGIRVDAEVTAASDVSKRLLTLLAATSGTDWIVIGIPFASIPDLKELIKLMGPSSICFARLNISSLAPFTSPSPFTSPFTSCVYILPFTSVTWRITAPVSAPTIPNPTQHIDAGLRAASANVNASISVNVFRVDAAGNRTQVTTGSVPVVVATSVPPGSFFCSSGVGP